MSRENQAERIGKMIRDGLGEPTDAASGGSAEEAVFTAMERAGEPRLSLRRLGAIAALMLAVTAGAIFFSLFEQQSMAYRIGGGEETDVSDWVRNSDLQKLPIVFENGSRFVLERRTIVKVMQADDERVRIDLNRGTLAASVNGNGHTEWCVDAGPYTVRVLGTVFTVVWDPDAEQLEVAVSSGHVAVSGADVGQGVVLEDGRRLVARRDGVHIDTRPACQSEPSVETVMETVAKKKSDIPNDDSKDGESAEQTAVLSENRTTPEKQNSPAAKQGIGDTSSDALQSRIDARDWPAAVAILEKTGVEKTARSAALDVLWHLADASRRSGRAALSEKLFTAVRRRFPRAERAATAAFLLGKIALDTKRDFAASKRWFNTYLSEAPGGPLAEEASGRLIEVYAALGQKSAAAKSARRYLESYPKGSFVDSARRHVDSGAAD